MNDVCRRDCLSHPVSPVQRTVAPYNMRLSAITPSQPGAGQPGTRASGAGSFFWQEVSVERHRGNLVGDILIIAQRTVSAYRFQFACAEDDICCYKGDFELASSKISIGSLSKNNSLNIREKGRNHGYVSLPSVRKCPSICIHMNNPTIAILFAAHHVVDFTRQHSPNPLDRSHESIHTLGDHLV